MWPFNQKGDMKSVERNEVHSEPSPEKSAFVFFLLRLVVEAEYCL